MRIRFFLAITAIALVVGCGDRQSQTEPAPSPTPGPAPAAVAPDASETELAAVTCPSPDLPLPQPDDTAIEPATYTVCDIGDPTDVHTNNGVTLSGKHLELDALVTVCDTDEVMRLKMPDQELDASAFIVDGKAQQLKGLANFQHDKGPARHLVKITRNNKGYEPPLDPTERRCNKEQNQIIRIQFCYFGKTDGDQTDKWHCSEPGAHQGDIHAQN